MVSLLQSHSLPGFHIFFFPLRLCMAISFILVLQFFQNFTKLNMFSELDESKRVNATPNQLYSQAFVQIQHNTGLYTGEYEKFIYTFYHKALI